MTRRTRLAVLVAILAMAALVAAAAIAADLFAGTAIAASRAAPLVSPLLPGDADVPPPDSSLAGQPEGPESVKRTPRPLGTDPDPVPVTSPPAAVQPVQRTPERPTGDLPATARRVDHRLASVAASTPAAGVPPVAGTIRGIATWFASPAGVSAAGPALRAALGPGWRGQTVRVCSGGRCVVTVLGDWCLCRGRPGGPTVIDLDAPDFVKLAPLSVGVLRVTVTPIPAPPETSTR